MVGHQAVAVAQPAVPFDSELKKLEESREIRFASEDRAPLVAAGEHVVERAWEQHPEWSRHVLDRTVGYIG